MNYYYLQPHRFVRQKEPKNVQNGPELKEIGLISMNFTKSVISPSVLVQKNVFGLVRKPTGTAIRVEVRFRSGPGPTLRSSPVTTWTWTFYLCPGLAVSGPGSARSRTGPWT